MVQPSHIKKKKSAQRFVIPCVCFMDERKIVDRWLWPDNERLSYLVEEMQAVCGLCNASDILTRVEGSGMQANQLGVRYAIGMRG